MIVDVLRHGSTGRPGYLDGRTDYPLSAEGWAQVQQHTRVGRWHRLVASPLLRAREPAETLARERTSPLRIDADWAEYDFGDWDGRRRSEIEAEPEERAALAAFYADPMAHPAPGGEPWIRFQTRIATAMIRVAAETDDRPTLVITHAGAIRLALSLTCGFPLTALWSLRIGYGTRIRLEVGLTRENKLWGEVIEIVQP